MALIKRHSIYLWNVQLLHVNRLGINLLSGRTLHVCGGNIALEQNEIIYGVLNYTSSCLTLNHLIMIENTCIFFTLTEYMKKNDPSSQIS